MTLPLKGDLFSQSSKTTEAGAPTTTLAYLCAPVDEALAKLAKGEQVTVRGGDMVCLRNELRACGVNC